MFGFGNRPPGDQPPSGRGRGRDDDDGEDRLHFDRKKLDDGVNVTGDHILPVAMSIMSLSMLVHQLMDQFGDVLKLYTSEGDEPKPQRRGAPQAPNENKKTVDDLLANLNIKTKETPPHGDDDNR